MSESLTRAENAPPYRGPAGFAVLIMALEGLEFVNARFSPEARDAVLVEMAARLKACVGKGGLLARSGGNEFAIFVTQLASQAEALRLAERIQLKVSTPFKIMGSTCACAVASVSHLVATCIASRTVCFGMPRSGDIALSYREKRTLQ
jgi:diguanylate cyclase (GGDEF)-like protein